MKIPLPLIELQTHNVKPDRVHQYMEAHNRMCQFFQANETEGVQLNCKCVGNFNVFVGEQDQFIHIWKFRDGYSTLDDAKKKMEGISEYKYVFIIVFCASPLIFLTLQSEPSLTLFHMGGDFEIFFHRWR